MKKLNLTLAILAIVGIGTLIWWTWNGMLKVDTDTCRLWAYIMTILCIGLSILAWFGGAKYGRTESRGALWGLDRGTEHTAQMIRATTSAAREERISAAQAPAVTALPVMPVIHRIESGGPVEI